METMVVSLKNKTDLQLIAGLLKKMNIEAKILTEEEREDIGLSKLLRQVNRAETVSEEVVMKKLKGR